MKVERSLRADALRWTGKNPIEFVSWISTQGIDWKYNETGDSFWVGMIEDGYFTDTVNIGDILVVVSDTPGLDFARPFVYSSVKQMERDGWSYDGPEF